MKEEHVEPRKSPIAKKATQGCGRGYGKNPIKGKKKQETQKMKEWMETHRA